MKYLLPNITGREDTWEAQMVRLAEASNYYATWAIVVVGVTLNAVIIWILKSRPRLRLVPSASCRLSHRNRSGVRSRSLSSCEIYMCGLAIVDTLFLVSYLLLNNIGTPLLPGILHESRAVCKLANFVRYTSRFCSCYFVVFFAYERFKAVRRPLERIKSSKSRTYTKVFVISVAIVSILINAYSPILFDIEKRQNDHHLVCVLRVPQIGQGQKLRLLRKAHSLFQFVIAFIVPIMLVCWFNISNIRVLLLRKNEILREAGIGGDHCPGSCGSSINNDPTRNETTAAKNSSSSTTFSTKYSLRDSNRATSILILVSVCFVGLNLPFVVARSWKILAETLISVAVECLVEVLHVANFALSFFLYCVASKQFRSEFLARLTFSSSTSNS